MSAGIKIIASTLGVAGLAGGITTATILRAKSVSTNSSADTTTSQVTSEAENQEREEQNLQTEPLTEVKKGNCTVVDLSEKGIFENLQIREEDYKAIYCEKTDDKDIESENWGKWTGLFHNSLFRGVGGLSVNTSFDLKTKSELTYHEVNDHFETTFESDEFLHSPVGSWGGSPRRIIDKPMTTVTITSVEHGGDGRIYLFLKQKI